MTIDSRTVLSDADIPIYPTFHLGLCAVCCVLVLADFYVPNVIVWHESTHKRHEISTVWRQGYEIMVSWNEMETGVDSSG